MGDVGQRALVFVAAAFLGLERFPAWTLRLIAENVRMPADHLGRNRRHDVIDGESAQLLGDAGMIDDLELEIAQFVLEVGHVVPADGVGNLIGFLDRVRRDRLERLDAVPFAAGFRVAEAAHDLDEIGEGGSRQNRLGACHSQSPIIYIM